MATKSIEKAPVAETVPVKTTAPALFDPWGDFQRMRTMMDEMMAEFFRPEVFRPRMIREAIPTWRPALNLHKENGNLVLEAAMPGLKKDDIQVNLTHETLNLQAHRKIEKKVDEKDCYCAEMQEGHFSTSLHLPMPIVADKVKAEYKDGILRLTMPMVEPERHKTVNIKIG